MNKFYIIIPISLIVIILIALLVKKSQESFTFKDLELSIKNIITKHIDSVADSLEKETNEIVKTDKILNDDILPNDNDQVPTHADVHKLPTPPTTTLDSDDHMYNLSPKEKTKILDLHNKYRKKAGLPPLKWDNSLENKTKEWIAHLKQTSPNRCIGRFRHPGTGNVDPQTAKEEQLKYLNSAPEIPVKNRMGQNIAYFNIEKDGCIADPMPDVADAISGWGPCECPRYNFENPEMSGHETGHFTQMMWKDTDRLGCSRHVCDDNTGKNMYYYCNYSPPGNVKMQDGRGGTSELAFQKYKQNIPNFIDGNTEKCFMPEIKKLGKDHCSNTRSCKHGDTKNLPKAD